jgi:hypothetical protein
MAYQKEDGIFDVGVCIKKENGTYKIRKGHSQTGNGGYIFKSTTNYQKPDKTLPVYVPEHAENPDEEYFTREDFEKLGGENADMIFEDVDWQYPETRALELE